MNFSGYIYTKFLLEFLSKKIVVILTLCINAQWENA